METPKIGTVVGYQIMWAQARKQWETVDEITYYRSLHNDSALCFGRLLKVLPDEPILTNEDGKIQAIPEGADIMKLAWHE